MVCVCVFLAEWEWEYESIAHNLMASLICSLSLCVSRFLSIYPPPYTVAIWSIKESLYLSFLLPRNINILFNKLYKLEYRCIIEWLACNWKSLSEKFTMLMIILVWAHDSLLFYSISLFLYGCQFCQFLSIIYFLFFIHFQLRTSKWIIWS